MISIMNTKQSRVSPPFNRPLYWTIGIAIIAGFFLSFLSWMNACTEACTATHEYRFFNIRFEWIGLVFFAIAAIFHHFSRQYQIFSTLVGLMMVAALGAEIVFIGVQKYEIGSWCPLCLSIASTVAVVVIAYGIDYWKNISQVFQKRQKGYLMKQILKSLTSISLFIFGFLIAFAGVAKPADASANEQPIEEQLELGNKNSKIRIYFISDWFCTACKKVEPEILKIYPAVKNQVSFIFVDLAVHANTANYTPYNLAFMIHDKARYMEIRHELDELSYREDAPSDEQIEKIAKKLVVPFHELSFRDIEKGMKYFEQITTKYNVKATPTVVIENMQTKKNAILNGVGEITLPNVEQTITKLSK